MASNPAASLKRRTSDGGWNAGLMAARRDPDPGSFRKPME